MDMYIGIAAAGIVGMVLLPVINWFMVTILGLPGLADSTTALAEYGAIVGVSIQAVMLVSGYCFKLVKI